MAQSVERLTLDFGSGHDLMVLGMEPCVGLHTDIPDPAWDSLYPSPACACSLSLSLSK